MEAKTVIESAMNRIKELREINNMPEDLINEKIIRERVKWAKIKG